MNLRLIFAKILVALCVAGCAITPQPITQRNRPAPLSPQLSPDVAMSVIVRDKRPLVEKEKKPSTEYLYSGALFAVEGNEKTVATDLSNLIMQCGGAHKAYATAELPTQGPALLFEMTHWYSRTPLKADKSLIFVTGEFCGTLSLYRDGKAVASVTSFAKSIPGVVDTTAFPWENNDNSKLIWKAMMRTANSAQQNGYSAIHAALLEHWHLLAK
jgi:hypothetical protein